MKKIKKIFKYIIVNILVWQSKLILLRYRPKIIAVTGSVGKTSTKDAIFTVLSHFKTVRKSEKSFNSEIGMPLSIIGAHNGWDNPFVWLETIARGFALILWKHQYPEYLILEVGAGKPGDIKNFAPWLAPDITVVTRFPDKPVHIEFFGSVEKIIEEKSALAYAVKKNGLLVLNHDDEKVYALHSKANRRTVSYGLHQNATYHATYPMYSYTQVGEINIPNGITFKLEFEGNTFPVSLPHILGMHYVGSALAALACAKEAGCEMLASIKALEEYTTPQGRLSLIEGINNSVIIDDTYNSSPVAVQAALDTLAEIKGARKIAVLGDMLELGKYTKEAHEELGDYAKDIADIIIGVGPRARVIVEKALESGFPVKNTYHFDTASTTGKFLEGILEAGDVVLLKGSQGVRLERATKAIMANKEDSIRLLCRQEKEWSER